MTENLSEYTWNNPATKEPLLNKTTWRYAEMIAEAKKTGINFPYDIILRLVHCIACQSSTH